jgi:hypothetical protein
MSWLSSWPSPPFRSSSPRRTGGEGILRLFLFTLPFMLIIAVAGIPTMAFTVRGALAVTALSALLLPAFLLACYGNEQFEQATPSDIAAANFVYDTAPPGSTLAVMNAEGFLGYQKVAQYNYVSAGDADLLRLSRLTPSRLLSLIGSHRSVYLTVTPAQRWYAVVTYGFPTDWVQQLTRKLSADPRFRLVYSRSDSYVYRIRPQPRRSTASRATT